MLYSDWSIHTRFLHVFQVTWPSYSLQSVWSGHWTILTNFLATSLLSSSDLTAAHVLNSAFLSLIAIFLRSSLTPTVQATANHHTTIVIDGESGAAKHILRCLGMLLGCSGRGVTGPLLGSRVWTVNSLMLLLLSVITPILGILKMGDSNIWSMIDS